MPSLAGPSPNGWPPRPHSTRKKPLIQASSNANTQSSQSPDSSSLGTSNGASASTQIIVDSSKSINGKPRSYWLQANISEVSDENRIPSLSFDETPDWMQEEPEQTIKVNRAHKVDLSKWSYTYPTDKKRSPPSRKTSTAPVSSHRRAKIDLGTKGAAISPPLQKTPAHLTHHGHPTVTATELEEGELRAGDSQQEPFHKVTTTNGSPQSKKPDRRVYQAPHLRGKPTDTTSTPPVREPKPSESESTMSSPEQVHCVPPHLRYKAAITDATVQGSPSQFSSGATSVTASPREGKHRLSSTTNNGGPKATSEHVSMASSTAKMNNDLLQLLKGLGVDETSATMRSISDALASHPRPSLQTDPQPKLIVSSDGPRTGSFKTRTSKLDPQAVSGGLSFDTDAILARSREDQQSFNKGNNKVTPDARSEGQAVGHAEEKQTNFTSVAPNLTWEQPSDISNAITTPSPGSKKGGNGSLVTINGNSNGQMPVSNVSINYKKVAQNGKTKVSSHRKAGEGVKIGSQSRAEFEDWHGRSPYYNPADRKAVASAFATEQANNLPDHDEVVDVNSRDFKQGLSVLVDDEEDILAEKMRDKQEPRRADSAGHMLPLPNQKTSNDRANAHMMSLSDHPLAGFMVNLGQEFRKMSKEEKRQMSSHFKTGPNPHAPKADIYLRPAETGDASQINDIWNHHIKNTIDVGYSSPWSSATWPDLIRQDTGIKLPFLVAVLKHGKKTKREKNEHIVGFGRAIACGDDTNAFRFSVELEVFVRDQSFQMGVGKTLFDRLMAAVAGPPYFTKNCAPMIGAEQPGLYDDGTFRRCHTIMVSIFHDGADDPSLKWKEAFLMANDFEKGGCIAKYAFKFGRL